MSVIRQSAREICAKIVYYGPGLSGKTTSLRRVYESIKPANRGEMISLATEGDRTLFFDFLPVKVERLGQATVRLALYTVPGQVFYNATRRLVLQGADGVVFVADSQPAAMDGNLESMDNLRLNLLDMGIHLEQFPLVIQYNKRDLSNALPIDELRRQLNPRDVPEFATVAAQGKGVLDALRAISRGVIKSLRAKGIVLNAPAKPVNVPTLSKDEEPSLASQLEAAALRAPQADPSLMSALVPEHVAGAAALAEADYRAGQYREAFDRAMEALRGLASNLGPAGMSEVELALMAGLSGPDYARLLRIEQEAAPSRDDAAFSLLMLGVAGTRSKR